MQLVLDKYRAENKMNFRSCENKQEFEPLIILNTNRERERKYMKAYQRQKVRKKSEN